MLSAIQFQEACFAAGLRLDFFFRHGDSLVTRARNDCVAYFLSYPQFTHLFWIDADIGYSPEAALRLLRADRDVVAGVYPLKREDWPSDGVPQGTTRARFEELYARYTVNTGRLGEDVTLVIDADGFMKVREAPTGFMCIRRKVFERLIAAYPELQYVPDWPEGSVPGGAVHYRFFDVTVDPESGRYLSEDYGFCRLWEKIGGEMYVDAQFQSHSCRRTHLYGRLRRDASPCASRRGGRAEGAAHQRHRPRQSQTESAVGWTFVLIYARCDRRGEATPWPTRRGPIKRLDYARRPR
jgi:hypothetical protein